MVGYALRSTEKAQGATCALCLLEKYFISEICVIKVMYVGDNGGDDEDDGEHV